MTFLITINIPIILAIMTLMGSVIGILSMLAIDFDNRGWFGILLVYALIFVPPFVMAVMYLMGRL